MVHNQHLKTKLGEELNLPLIDDLRFWNSVLGNQKVKKQKSNVVRTFESDPCTLSVCVCGFYFQIWSHILYYFHETLFHLNRMLILLLKSEKIVQLVYAICQSIHACFAWTVCCGNKNSEIGVTVGIKIAISNVFYLDISTKLEISMFLSGWKVILL